MSNDEVLFLKTRLEHIGNNIRQRRKLLNLSQIDVAVDVGIDRAYLSEIENGRTNVTINILYAIADSLDIPLIDLLAEPTGQTEE